MKTKLFSLLIIIFLVSFLSACGNSSNQQTEVVDEPKQTIDYGQYAKIEIEPKEFTFGKFDLLYTNKTFPNILNDYELILSTSDTEINRFPEIKELMTIKNTNPQIVIIPKYFQIQYEIIDITCKNGIISINYKTENNTKIDRVIGQIYDVPYSIYYIDLGILPNGKYRVEFIDKSGTTETITKDINIHIPELITEWQVKNINYANAEHIIYTSNKTGNWQVYRQNLITKETIQVSDHTDSVISNLNNLGYDHNDINIPYPRYNKNLNSIYYAINADIYRYEDMGDNIFRKFNISLENMQTNMLNGYYTFEKQPILSKSGYKYLHADISDPTQSKLFIGETFDQGKKVNIQLPATGTIEFFDWGKTENEYIVALSPNTNERTNGQSSIWLIKDNDNTKITTNGYKINSVTTSSNKDFVVFSQKLASTESDMRYDIYSTNMNNTNLKRLTPKDDYRDINPTISPNNQKIAYMSSPDGTNYNLFVMNVNGSNRRKVTDIYITDKPFWLNNNEILIIDSFANIIRINIDTADTEIILDGFDKLDIEAERAKLEEMKFSN